MLAPRTTLSAAKGAPGQGADGNEIMVDLDLFKPVASKCSSGGVYCELALSKVFG